MASAIEDAGFEVRDMIEWVYGSGFPKSLNIGKAVDKLQGNERVVVGKKILGGIKRARPDNTEGFSNPYTSGQSIGIDTKGTSEWEGWGTALKPAHEPICMARKPLSEKTVAENCLKWGTGGIDIDGSRVGTETITQRLATVEGGKAIGGKGVGIKQKATGEITQTIGRFPANLIHDNSEEVRECFPDVKTGSITKDIDGRSSNSLGTFKVFTGRHNGDNGSASRFFKSIIYQAKASKSERNRGCEELEEKDGGCLDGNSDMNNNRKIGANPSQKVEKTKNNHPTVKPIALMEYLIKMVTKPGGIVLDPFAGSGTTLVAAKKNGYNYIGIELTEDYIPIIKARLSLPD